jgi:hypothetical protein
MQLTYIVWVESRKTRDDGRGKTKDSVKNMSLHHGINLFPLVVICWCFVYNKSKVKFMYSSTYVEHYIK